MYAVQGPDSLKAMNAMLDAPVDDLKRFGICERKLGDIPVYIHRSGFTGENGYRNLLRIRQERRNSRSWR